MAKPRKECPACTHNHPVCRQCGSFNDAMLQLVKHGSHNKDADDMEVYNYIGDRAGTMNYWFCDSGCLRIWLAGAGEYVADI